MWDFNWLYDALPWSTANRERRAFRAIDTVYQTSWLARRGIDQPVDDMFKTWRRWDKSHQDVMKKAEKKHKIKQLFKDSKRYAKLYGGIVVIPILKGQDDLEKPLDLDSIQKDDLIKFVIFDRWYVGKTQINYTDPVAENYLRPLYYTLPINGKKGQSLKVHYSRVTELSGLKVPLHLQRQGVLWGNSELIPALDTINQYNRAVDATARLVEEQTIDVLRKEQWAEASTTEERENIETHMDWLARVKRTRRMMIGDKKDDFDRKSVSLSGVAPSMEIIQEDASGCFKTPATLLFGKAKAGMSGDTNDGDIRNYKDILAVQQEDFGDDMSLIDDVLIRSTFGSIPENIEYKWSPLDVMTGTEQAEALLKTTQAAQAAVEAAILAPEEARSIFENNSDFTLDETQYKAHVVELKAQAEKAQAAKNEPPKQEAA
ncbi:DUF1073 domain-containing protein [Vibrio parahaemolyticus]|nr:DUF1073 domain-containing protein [Vibrio parahaemolyticus]